MPAVIPLAPDAECALLRQAAALKLCDAIFGDAVQALGRLQPW